MIQSIKGEDVEGILGYALKLSHDNKFLYSSAGYVDTTIKVWDLKTGYACSDRQTRHHH